MPSPHLLPFLAMIIALMAWTIPVPCFCAKCKERCGKLNIIFPFYLKGTTFFDGKPACGLRGYELECSENRLSITLGQQKYEVLELQAGALRIDPVTPNVCVKNNLKSFQLFNTTYRLCSHNMLQLYDCNRTCGDCSVPLPVNQSLSQSLTGCPYSHPRCCESLEMSFFNNSPEIRLFDFTAGYQSLQNYSSHFGCSSFSSWAYSSSGRTLSFLADYGLLLQWYIRGNCSSCSLNAICNNTAYGYTCKCSPHYSGDGYAAGVGCHLGTAPASDGNGVMRRRSLIENSIMLSGIVAAAFFLGVVVVCGAVLLRRRRERLLLGRRIRGASFRNVDVSGLNLLLSDLELFTYKQLDKATKGFASSEKLGNGASGAVYVAKLEDSRRVAVKRLHNFNSHTCYQQTLNELSVLSAVKHRNLVRLLGCCTEFPEPLLVFEYVSNGTLAEHLQRERGDGLDWFTRLTIAAEAADALAYLHSMDPPILHRDVKSRNILLDHEFNTKVADFGLSRMGPTLSCDGSHISTIPQGTPGYLDPDYHQNFHLSNKSDVYSFGVVLIEIITALKPVDFSRKKKEVNLAALAVAKIAAGCLDDIIDPFLEANKRFHVKAMVQRVSELAFRCLAYDKDARPPMTEVLEELLLIRGSTVAPILDAPDDDESEGFFWMDAHSLQEHGSASSCSLSETDRHALLVKSQPCPSGVQGSEGITIPEDA